MERLCHTVSPSSALRNTQGVPKVRIIYMSQLCRHRLRFPKNSSFISLLVQLFTDFNCCVIMLFVLQPLLVKTDTKCCRVYYCVEVFFLILQKNLACQYKWCHLFIAGRVNLIMFVMMRPSCPSYALHGQVIADHRRLEIQIDIYIWGVNVSSYILIINFILFIISLYYVLSSFTVFYP